MARPTVLVVCSDRNAKWTEKLVSQLRVVEHSYALDVWSDSRVATESGFDQALRSASLVVLMITSELIPSEALRSSALPKMLAPSSDTRLSAIGVLTTKCAREAVPWLKDVPTRPSDGKPLAQKLGRLHASELAKIAREIAGMALGNVGLGVARWMAGAVAADLQRAPEAFWLLHADHLDVADAGNGHQKEAWRPPARPERRRFRTELPGKLSERRAKPAKAAGVEPAPPAIAPAGPAPGR